MFYPQKLMYSSNVTVTLVVTSAPAVFLSLTRSRGSLITLSFLSILVLLLSLAIVTVLVIRKRKSPSVSSGSSECSSPPEAPYLSPIWTHQDSSTSTRNLETSKRSSLRNLDLQRISVLNVTEKAVPRYIHPLNPSLVLTSTPVTTPGRRDTDTTSFHFNVSGCLDTSAEHNHSIGDIVEGNFVSFSSSDMYCLNLTEMAERSVERSGPGDTSVLDSIPEVEREASLCDQCRSSLCSRSSSTDTLTGRETECSQGSSGTSRITESTTSLQTLNIDLDNIDASTSESVVTVENKELKEDLKEEEKEEDSPNLESVIDTPSDKLDEET